MVCSTRLVASHGGLLSISPCVSVHLSVCLSVYRSVTPFCMLYCVHAQLLLRFHTKAGSRSAQSREGGHHQAEGSRGYHGNPSHRVHHTTHCGCQYGYLRRQRCVSVQDACEERTLIVATPCSRHADVLCSSRPLVIQ